MLQDLAGQVVQRLDEVSNRYYQLILIVGPSGSGKTSLLRKLEDHLSGNVINLALELSYKLLNLSARQRISQLSTFLKEVTDNFPVNPLLLDNTEILFDPSLKHDPLVLLQKLARNRKIVASWNGVVKKGWLIHAEPWHAEYRRYQVSEVVIINLSHDEYL